MSLREKQVDKMWDKLGFVVDPKKKDVSAVLWINNKIILTTKRSHGAGKLDGMIPTFIRNQMKLNERQFADAYDCPLGREAYYEILRAKGLIPDE